MLPSPISQYTLTLHLLCCLCAIAALPDHEVGVSPSLPALLSFTAHEKTQLRSRLGLVVANVRRSLLQTLFTCYGNIRPLKQHLFAPLPPFVFLHLLQSLHKLSTSTSHTHIHRTHTPTPSNIRALQASQNPSTKPNARPYTPARSRSAARRPFRLCSPGAGHSRTADTSPRRIADH